MKVEVASSLPFVETLILEVMEKVVAAEEFALIQEQDGFVVEGQDQKTMASENFTQAASK